MNLTLLRHVYQLHKIKKKALKWFKRASHPDPTKEAQQYTTMKRQLTKAKNDGYRIVYLDEICFTRTTVPKKEYTKLKKNMPSDLAHLNEPTLAVLSAISKEQG